MSVLVGSLSSNMSWDQWGRTWISTPVTEKQVPGESQVIPDKPKQHVRFGVTPCGGLEDKFNDAEFVDVKAVSFVLFPDDQSNPWDKKELGEVSMELTKRMLFDMQKMWDRPA